jgi:hypothetical protein
MLSPAELALFLRVSAARVKPHLKHETEKLVEQARDQAKVLIGQEYGGWPALAESTIVQKTRLGYVGNVSATDPLLRTGHMRASIEAKAEVSAEGATGVVGSNDKVAVYQEMGTSRIPPRPFLATSLMGSQRRAEKAFGEMAVLSLVPGIR